MEHSAHFLNSLIASSDPDAILRLPERLLGKSETTRYPASALNNLTLAKSCAAVLRSSTHNSNIIQYVLHAAKSHEFFKLSLHPILTILTISGSALYDILPMFGSTSTIRPLFEAARANAKPGHTFIPSRR